VILGDEPPDETGALSGDATRIARAVRTKKPDRRLRAVMEVAKTKGVCWSCSAAQPSYKKDGLMIHAEFKARARGQTRLAWVGRTGGTVAAFWWLRGVGAAGVEGEEAVETRVAAVGGR
jgi:hypothetical protein